MSLYNYSQNPVLSLEEDMGLDDVIGAYYKDTNNVLDEFEGTWVYTDNATNTTFKIVLVKKTMVYSQGWNYYEDLMVGEYQYSKNGLYLINTLSDLPLNLGRNHNIKGNFILDTCDYLPWGDCIEGEKRLYLGISDPVKPYTGKIILKKRIINGQEAVKAYVSFSYKGADRYQQGAIRPEPTITYQDEFIMFKQP